jgi:menaquinone-dependent protoporphyrinogen oxidase
MTTNESGRPRVLVSAASKHESTSEIARVIGGTLADKGIDVDIVPPEAVDSIADYDAVVLGSAVYNGHWLSPATDLATRFQDELAARSLWLFSSGPVGIPASGKIQSARQVPAEIALISRAAQPRDHRVFAGRLDPQRLSRTQRVRLLVFRGMRGDFRDWAEIGQWADAIAADLTAAGAGEGSH